MCQAHERPALNTVLIDQFFWAFAAVLARHNRPIFFVVSLITTGVNVTYQDAQRKCRYNFSIFLGI